MADTVPNMDIDRIVEKYVQVRDKKNEIKKRHAEELAPYDAALDTIEGKLLMALNVLNADSFKTKHGTAFKSIRSSVAIKDFTVALDYIIENGLYHMLEKRLSKTAVEEFVESQGQNFPGTSINRETIVNIRRK